MSEYSPKPKTSAANVNIELDLSNFGTKVDLDTLDTLDFAKKD